MDSGLTPQNRINQERKRNVLFCWIKNKVLFSTSFTLRLSELWSIFILQLSRVDSSPTCKSFMIKRIAKGLKMLGRERQTNILKLAFLERLWRRKKFYNFGARKRESELNRRRWFWQKWTRVRCVWRNSGIKEHWLDFRTAELSTFLVKTEPWWFRERFYQRN